MRRGKQLPTTATGGRVVRRFRRLRSFFLLGMLPQQL